MQVYKNNEESGKNDTSKESKKASETNLKKKKKKTEIQELFDKEFQKNILKELNELQRNK